MTIIGRLGKQSKETVQGTVKAIDKWVNSVPSPTNRRPQVKKADAFPRWLKKTTRTP